MTNEDRVLLKNLLTTQRVLSLAVMVDGKPNLGLLPFAMTPDFSALLIQASRLARHSRGLDDGAQFAALIHGPDTPEADALQIARVSFEGEVHPVAADASGYAQLRDTYLGRFPQAEITFQLGDFTLYELRIREGRLVGGFARATNVTLAELRQIK